MSFLCIDKDGTEKITSNLPYRLKSEGWFKYSNNNPNKWFELDDYADGYHAHDYSIELPKGSIFKLINKELTWFDEHFEI